MNNYKEDKIIGNIVEGFYLYRFINSNNKIVYIGKTKNMKQRMSRYSYSNGKNQIKAMDEIDIIEFAELKSEYEMNILEVHYISKFKPKYNAQFNTNDTELFELPDVEWKTYPKRNIRKRSATSKTLIIYYNNNSLLYEKLKPHDVCRIIYLYSRIGSNEVSIYYAKSKLNIDKNVFKRFIKNISCNDYAVIDKDKIRLSIDRKMIHDNKVKIYTEKLFDLYDNSKAGEHHKIGFFFRMIPYIDMSSGYLTSHKNDNKEREIIDITQYSKMSGYSLKQCLRTISSLSKMRFSNGEPLIELINDKSDVLRQSNILVNLKLFSFSK